MKANEVPRIGRILDLVGLLLFVVGGGVFVRAWLGFQAVRHYQPGPHDPLWSAIRRADGFLRLQHVGAAIMGVGITVFLIAWWTAGRKRKTAAPVESPTSPELDGSAEPTPSAESSTDDAPATAKEIS